MYKVKKLTDCKWLNLFEVFYTRCGAKERSWMMCSRKPRPLVDAAVSDAVMIVAIVNTENGPRLVVTREFRVPIWDYEYSFPAGLIDSGDSIESAVRRELKEETGLDVLRIVHISPPVYSTAGMSDESNHMVLVEAGGRPSNAHLEADEEIQTLLMDSHDLKNLLASKCKIAAKAWGLLYHFAKTREITF